MSKKQDLLPSFLREEPTEKPIAKTATKAGRPKVKPEAEKTTEVGCRQGETRFTTILDKELLEQVRRLAYWDRRTVKGVFTLALRKYVEDYAKANGSLQPIPDR